MKKVKGFLTHQWHGRKSISMYFIMYSIKILFTIALCLIFVWEIVKAVVTIVPGLMLIFEKYIAGLTQKLLSRLTLIQQSKNN